MTTAALDISAAHPLYLYVVFVVCVVAAVALLIGASLSRRSSSWRRQMQAHAPSTSTTGAAYPVEPAPATAETDATDVTDSLAEPVTVAAKKPAARKTATTARTGKKTTAARKAPAKKATARKATAKPSD